jgi:hypothetical protein
MFAHYGNSPGNDLLALTAIMKRPPSEHGSFCNTRILFIY